MQRYVLERVTAQLLGVDGCEYYIMPETAPKPWSHEGVYGLAMYQSKRLAAGSYEACWAAKRLLGGE